MKRLSAGLIAGAMLAQGQVPITVTPRGPKVIRSYEPADIPPVRLNNSARMGQLIRAGNLYLSLRDAIAIAVENNLDLEIDRYGPLLADWALKRAEAGGPIRGVPSGSAQVSAVDSGLGAAGSIQAAGLGGGNGGGGGGGNAGGATVQQIGQITPNLDPNLQNATSFSHQTQPQANTIVTQTSAYIQDKRTYNTVLQQGLITGGIFQLIDYEQHDKENVPSDLVNPAVGPYIDVYLRHSLLQGLGVRLNDRFIRIAKMNLTGARETFRLQVQDTVANVINIYWDLVSANDEVKARQRALDIARKFQEDARAQIEIGAMARVELPRAQAEFASRQQDLRIAQATARQQEIRLKDALSRREDSALETAAIIPVDRIAVPPADDLPALRTLVASAMTNRPDVAIAKIRDQAQEISALGTTNPLLPSLTVTAQAYNRGSAGTYQPSSQQYGAGAPNPQFLGGYGKALGQILRRDYPNESLNIQFSAPLENRLAQADYGIDRIQLRQAAVAGQRDNNAIVVAISNQLIQLRQARARYSAAVNTRDLQEQLLTAEQQKFSYGKSSTNNLIVAQRALVAAQTSEIVAAAAYAHARVALDQVSGETLNTNRVSLDEALGGRVSWESGIPAAEGVRQP
ncbi:MAG TPA: TolC family protein [Bryobacteraceae bacterium]|nr:TolC family protein [Bryobacteraceae bacterium]